MSEQARGTATNANVSGSDTKPGVTRELIDKLVDVYRDYYSTKVLNDNLDACTRFELVLYVYDSHPAFRLPVSKDDATDLVNGALITSLEKLRELGVKVS